MFFQLLRYIFHWIMSWSYHDHTATWLSFLVSWTATSCNIMQHHATSCNIMQHHATIASKPWFLFSSRFRPFSATGWGRSDSDPSGDGGDASTLRATETKIYHTDGGRQSASVEGLRLEKKKKKKRMENMGNNMEELLNILYLSYYSIVI